MEPQPPTLASRDPDSSRMDAGRPAPHLRLGVLALIAAGGAVGTWCREALSLLVPRVDDVPVVILGINVAGAFLLGLLIESLTRRGPDAGRRRLVRLGLGTGVLGGFTTYSTLAVDTVELLDAGRAGPGLGYALTTLVLGGLATALGIVLGARLHARVAS